MAYQLYQSLSYNYIYRKVRRSQPALVGLDPQVGFLHTDRPGRASLALD